VSSVADGLSSVFRGAGVVFLGTIAGKAFALGGHLLIVRSLSEGAFGTLALSFSIVALLGNVSTFGAAQGATRFISATDDYEERISYLRASYLIALTGSILIAGTLLVSRGIITNVTRDPDLIRALLVLSPYIVLFSISDVSIGGLRGLKHSALPILARDVIGRGSALVLLGAAVAMGMPRVGTVGYWLAMPFITVIAAIYYLHAKFELDSILGSFVGVDQIRELWSFSWPLAVSASFVQMMANIDVLVIGAVLEPSSVAAYKAVQPLSTIVGLALVAAVFLYLPVATEYYTDGKYTALAELYSSTTKWILTAAFPVALTFILFSDNIIRYMLRPTYVHASLTLSLLTIGVFSRSLVGPNGATVSAIGRTKIDMYAGFFGLVTNIILNILLVKQFGIEGAAVATGAGFMVFNGIEVWMIYREIEILPLGSAALKPMVPTALVAAIASQLLPSIVSLPVIVGVGLLLGVVHLLSLLIGGGLSGADIELVSQVEEQLGVNLSIIRRFD
jgi:O-antigen/teichoic acid export membrane protein